MHDVRKERGEKIIYCTKMLYRNAYITLFTCLIHLNCGWSSHRGIKMWLFFHIIWWFYRLTSNSQQQISFKKWADLVQTLDSFYLICATSLKQSLILSLPNRKRDWTFSFRIPSRNSSLSLEIYSRLDRDERLNLGFTKWAKSVFDLFSSLINFSKETLRFLPS